MAKKTKQNKFILPISAVVIAIIGYLSTNSSNGQLSQSSSDQSLCLSEFHQNVPPVLINSNLKNRAYPLCYTGFSMMYSGLSKTPLWVAEKLTHQRLAIKIPREDSFHEEDRVPEADRATLADYRGSGYDRGHMAPNADMNNKTAQHDSFSLANMVPQTPENNQHIWREIEESTRAMVNKYKLEAYVITGPAFLNKTVKYSKSGAKVFVPSHVYKVVYFPQTKMSSVYFAANDKSKTAKLISICELEQKIGINVLPNVDEQTKRQVFNFPMQANKVKANKAPVYLKTDTSSQCAPSIDVAEITQIQQQFIIGYNHAKKAVDATASTAQTTPAVTESSSDVDQIILKIIQIFKEMDK